MDVARQQGLALRAATTGMAVQPARIAGRELSCPAPIWVMTTKAMGGGVGMARNSACSASTPPADAPMPTTGKGKGCSLMVLAGVQF
jgi:hypothetical protein